MREKINKGKQLDSLEGGKELNSTTVCVSKTENKTASGKINSTHRERKPTQQQEGNNSTRHLPVHRKKGSNTTQLAHRMQLATSYAAFYLRIGFFYLLPTNPSRRCNCIF
ncbi:hypothetical protein NPIL_162651 [Nephila pilipes]|uniref:Uncharacterized protein n=1 Tax=Nephila pilipes TaxID=299642 RepID=A0A8X6PFW6_NEPPI|nr:hypothetical protein NPIL_162651 [Nephila pilipes]